ncbi:MAG: DUF433 domain-containing protein [Nitrospirae bacterium]|nr:MAG: DUF433 domain-containing protein [Nitrospirota bacterium]
MKVRLQNKPDIRELPAYSITEAAHYLLIPPSTLRWWVTGRRYDRGILRVSKPIIELPEEDGKGLSFMNLVEIHVLDAIRRKHDIALNKVRKALQYLGHHLPSRHPLAEREFETDGISLFIEQYGKLINISEEGQLAIRELLEAHLKRIERDTSGLPIRLYPFTRKRAPQEPMAVVIDPYVSFGRPVLVGTGIPTAVIAARYKAGESVDDLADDYGRSREEIEEAIRCERFREAA